MKSSTIEHDLERLESAFDGGKYTLVRAIQRAWLIAARRLLSSGKSNRPNVDLLLDQLKVVGRAQVALEVAQWDVNTADDAPKDVRLKLKEILLEANIKHQQELTKMSILLADFFAKAEE